jgi:hypothetical protein
MVNIYMTLKYVTHKFDAVLEGSVLRDSVDTHICRAPAHFHNMSPCT